jgi:hypothetical protein
MASSHWLDAEIQKRAVRLTTIYPDIMSCKVLVEKPHRHHEQGNPFHVRIDITVPGEKIVAGHSPSLHLVQPAGNPARERKSRKTLVRKDALLALHQAFDAAKRQLRDYAHVRRYDVKTHVNARQADALA